MILEAAATLLVFNLILGVKLYLSVKDLYGQPGVLGLPVIGNLYYFYKTIIFSTFHSGVLYYSKIIDKDGKGYAYHFFQGKKCIIVSCPHILEKIAFHPNLVDKPPVVFSSMRVISEGVFSHAIADSQWKEKRKDLNESMKRVKVEGPYHHFFVESGKCLVEDLVKNRNHIDTEILCLSTSVNAIMETHVGMTENLRLPMKIYELMSKSVVFVGRSFFNPIEGHIVFRLWKIYDNLCLDGTRKIWDMAQEKINKILRDQEKKPVEEQLNMPLGPLIVFKNSQRNIAMSQSLNEIHELVNVGSHTVATLLSTALQFLAVLPDIQHRVWQEQYEIFGSSTRDPTLSDVKQMEYLDRFVKETLRFGSPVMIFKYASGDINIEETVIPAGTIVLVFLGKSYRDPKYWKNPNVFDTDRFLEFNNPKYSYMPFGIGVRSCPGKYYAEHQIKTILSTVIRKFKLSSPNRFEDFKYDYSIMTAVTNPPVINIEERKCSFSELE